MSHLQPVPDTPPGVERTPVTRFDYERWVRRAALAPELKYVALMMATFANGKGGQVRPGDPLLAQACGKGLRTIVRNRGELERLGWLEQVPRRRRSDANEYFLTVPADLAERPDTAPVEEV